MEFSRYWSGLPFPSPGDLPNLGIEAGSPALQGGCLLSELPVLPQEKTLVSITLVAFLLEPITFFKPCKFFKGRSSDTVEAWTMASIQVGTSSVNVNCVIGKQVDSREEHQEELQAFRPELVKGRNSLPGNLSSHQAVSCDFCPHWP